MASGFGKRIVHTSINALFNSGGPIAAQPTVEYGLMVFSAGAALVAQQASTLVSWLLVLLVLLVYVVLMLVVTFVEQGRESA